MDKVLEILQQKSWKALKEAKDQLLVEKIQSKVAREALEYYIENWNDTTHPGILALACEAVGGDAERAIPVQIALLYLSAAMDLHDDIIDQCRVKGGKPTVFGKYGKDIALLLGNAMMIKGLTFLCYYVKECTLETFKRIVQEIKTKLFDLGNAHLLEIDLKGKMEIPPNHYLQILEKKASSIAICTKIGAIIGGGSLQEIKALERYGNILGLLIGLREEFIDIFEPHELKNRMENEILPLPILCALKSMKMRKKILRILQSTEITEEEAEKLVDYVFHVKKVKNLQNYMRELAKKALNIIYSKKDRIKIQNLTLLVKGVLEDL
jgi:geranylgeranyl pyrophosphate synthase